MSIAVTGFVHLWEGRYYSEQVRAQHAGQLRLASIADLSGDGVVLQNFMSGDFSA